MPTNTVGALRISQINNSPLAVCICTFRRPLGLARLLRGLDRQAFNSATGPQVELVVVDNSPEAGARQAMADWQGRWPLHYRHEPQPGISHARNTSLAAVPVGTAFIAMIDDDEEPAENWLQALLSAQAQSGADIIVGPTLPSFPHGTAHWIAATGFFPKPQNYQSLGELDPDPPAATCNALLRASLFDDPQLRFDPQLALSGGEDKLLFQDLKLRGHRFAWAADALALEFIPPERATLAYMWREAFRRGSVKYLVKRRLKARSGGKAALIALRLLLRSVGRTLRDAVLLLPALLRGRAAWVPRVLAIANSLGTCAGVLGVRNRHYRPGNSS
ncbi:MAG: succinoglycan biosynthesis protein ExoM [Bacteroidia bacterium]|jgi:succinoglycan biosynthesis protein ExoM